MKSRSFLSEHFLRPQTAVALCHRTPTKLPSKADVTIDGMCWRQIFTLENPARNGPTFISLITMADRDKSIGWIGLGGMGSGKRIFFF